MSESVSKIGKDVTGLGLWSLLCYEDVYMYKHDGLYVCMVLSETHLYSESN